MEKRRCYRFNHFTVDLDRGYLLRGDTEIALRPKAYEALVHLVERAGRLMSKAELTEALWPNTAVTDDSLVKCIRDVRRALHDDAHKCIRTVPRRGYIFEATVVACEEPLQPLQAAAGRTIAPRVLRARVLIAFSVAVLAAAAYWLPQPTRTVLPNSIAVLPFENLSPNPDDAYFAAGIHESILNQLAKIDHVHAISRSSVLRYADRRQPLDVIAADLKVETVMEGSVRYADGRVIVTAQLIDPDTQSHIWSQEYDRPFAGVFSIQADIARRIAAAFEAELSQSDQKRLTRAPTGSADAYQLYLRGRYHWDKWTRAEVRRSVAYYKRAIGYDAEFGLAWAGLADAYTALVGLGADRPIDLMPLAKEAAGRALEIDAALPEGHVAMGLIRHFYEWDYDGGNQSFRTAIALSPKSATAHHLYGKNLPVTLQFAKAFAELERALQLDPYSVGINKDLGETLYYAREYSAAIDQLQRTLELEPGYLIAYFWLSRCYEALGRPDQAIESHLAMYVGDSHQDEAANALREAHAAAGWSGYWREHLRQLNARSRDGYVEPYRFVESSIRSGDNAVALEWLERCFVERCSWIPTIAMDPLLEPLRDDPRFVNLVLAAGLQLPPLP